MPVARRLSRRSNRASSPPSPAPVLWRRPPISTPAPRRPTEDTRTSGRRWRREDMHGSRVIMGTPSKPAGALDCGTDLSPISITVGRRRQSGEGEDRYPINSASSSSARARLAPGRFVSSRTTSMTALTPDMMAAPSRRGLRMASCTVVAVCSMSGREIGDQTVDALDLARGQRADAGGVAGNRVDAVGQRLHLVLDLLEQPVEAASHAHAIDNDADLNGRHGKGRQRDNPEEHFCPETHTLSILIIGQIRLAPYPYSPNYQPPPRRCSSSRSGTSSGLS